MNWFRRFARCLGKAAPAGRRARPRLEHLETRLVPYSVSGNAWPAPQLVTISFVPDGTTVSTNGSTAVTSNLFSKLNARFGSAAAWQSVILKAAQTWAQQANVNFAVVSDDGSPLGSGSYQQGDPTKGDVRIGGYVFGNTNLATAYLPPPVNNYSIAGDVVFNTGQTWNSGATYDLFTVATHEIGHALGLYHSATVSAQMYSAYNGVKNALSTDDVNGIKAAYGARPADAYDANGANADVFTADDLSGLINATTKTALVSDLDVGATTDVDFYKVTVPAGTSGTLKVQVQSAGLSLLRPAVTLYNSAGTQLATLNGTKNGDTITLTRTGVAAGQVYYVKVDGADATAFGTGKYALALNFGTGATPTASPPNTALARGSTTQGGGGVATHIGPEVLVNTYTEHDQWVGQNNQRSIATDASGNYVIVWQSKDQDGDKWGVYAQRFAADGSRLGGEFQVNTATRDEQRAPSVDMAPDGSFVIVWQSKEQDGDSWGVFAQRFAANGSRLGGELRVNTFTEDEQIEPSVAMAPDGSFVVVWQSKDQDGDNWGVYAQRFAPGGSRLGPEVRVNTFTEGEQTEPSVAVASDGSFVVVWQSKDQDGDKWGVSAQRFAADGSRLGGETLINTTNKGEQQEPSIDVGRDGSYVVAWQSKDQDGDNWGVYAQRFAADGSRLGGEFLVNTSTKGEQTDPTVAAGTAGDWVITWSNREGQLGNWTLYGQQYSSLGERIDQEFVIGTTQASEQRYSSVGMSQGIMIVAWQGRGEQDDHGVYAQRFDLSGAGLAAGAASDSFNPDGCDHGHGHEEGHCCADCGTSSAGGHVATFSGHAAAGGLVSAPAWLAPAASPQADGPLSAFAAADWWAMSEGAGRLLAGPAARQEAEAGELWVGFLLPSGVLHDEAAGAPRSAAHRPQQGESRLAPSDPAAESGGLERGQEQAAASLVSSAGEDDRQGPALDDALAPETSWLAAV